jgi:hypothetical protein
MKRRPDPRQLELLDWAPPMACVITHPAVWRKFWAHEVAEIAQAIVDEPEKAHRHWQWTPFHLANDLRAAGASEPEAMRETRRCMQAIAADVARRQHGVRQGPGAA